MTTAACGGGVSATGAHPGKHEQPAIKILTQKINNTIQSDLFIAHLPPLEIIINCPRSCCVEPPETGSTILP
ncbi:hypothetical protein SBDP1_1140001 [Syntrophobacter sp. SbD1]|nr:hypothetical protein SBDP1_1140001 [Syntrophobacter sp. SbD1]